MENRKFKIFKFPQQVPHNGNEEVLLRCGETVPRSGIYEAVHSRGEAENEGTTVVAVKGEQVQPCKSCGDGIQLRLIYAAPHISEDGDFCPPTSQMN